MSYKNFQKQTRKRPTCTPLYLALREMLRVDAFFLAYATYVDHIVSCFLMVVTIFTVLLLMDEQLPYEPLCPSVGLPYFT